ncbi:chemotaxis protein CheB, partial [Citrobacter portucalensis]|uniref:chemotaxis protein CheB n=1 Tax=Citrobacter portucalensis TaxID=1639133 RepID=UPI002B4A1721
STGGPQALSKLLQDLPGTFPCPVLIAQHIADGFAKHLSHRLQQQVATGMVNVAFLSWDRR